MAHQTWTTLYSPNLPSARRSIVNAINTGQELDVYEGLARTLQFACDAADKEHPTIRAYYCGPQGLLLADWKVKLRELDRLHDGDYQPPEERSEHGNEEGDEQDLGKRAVEDDAIEEALAPIVPDVANFDSVLVADNGLGEDKTANHGPEDLLPPAALSNLSASTSSSVEVTLQLKRIPDFRISMAYLENEEEIVRYNIALSEVKLYNLTDFQNSGSKKYLQAVNKVHDAMVPQVIQAVQLAFKQKEDQQEIAAIPIVNEYCRFLYFKRDTVPELDMSGWSRNKNGYVDPDGLKGNQLLKKLAYKKSSSMQMIRGVQRTLEGRWKPSEKVTFGDTFLRNWEEFINWTRRQDLFPDPLHRPIQH